MRAATAGMVAGPRTTRRRVSGRFVYLALAATVGLTFVLGMHGAGVARPLFLLGCLGTAWLAWRSAPGRHVEIAVALFVLAPFLRRVVDAGAGYEPSGLMLTGPLLAIFVPVLDLPRLLASATDLRRLLPHALVGLCAVITVIHTVALGDMVAAGVAVVKWGAPLLYGVWLALSAEEDPTLVKAMTRAFLVAMPIAGAYGVFQYVDPPDWDRYWMVSSQMNSIGLPVPLMVRVFSTMNSPQSFAVFATCGLLLAGFCVSGWQALLMALPCSLGLLLSMYRTAWIELVVGVAFCLLPRVSRGRAIAVFVALGATAVVATTLTPFGDVITARIQSMGKGTDDGSAAERMAEYVTLYSHADDTMLGIGFGTPTATAMPIDGQIVACWYQMGIPVGLACLIGLVWAGLQAVAETRFCLRREQAVLGAIVLGELLEMPLAGIASAETGFLFWSVVGLAMAEGARTRRELRASGRI